jgi:hypothetical protein
VKATALLEPVSGLAFTAAAYLGAGIWPALIVIGVVLTYLAQRHGHGPWLTHLQTLRLKPGDVLVARIPASLPRPEYDAVHLRLQRDLPGVKITVVPDTLELAKIERVE